MCTFEPSEEAYILDWKYLFQGMELRHSEAMKISEALLDVTVREKNAPYLFPETVIEPKVRNPCRYTLELMVTL